MINLKNFLESDSPMILEEKRLQDWGIALGKMYTTIDNIYYVLMDDWCRGSIFNPLSISDRKFLGIYDKKDGVFYFADNYMSERCGLDKTDLSYTSLEELHHLIVQEVNESILNKIQYDENNLDVNLDDIKPSDYENVFYSAKRLFLNSKEMDKNSYASYKLTKDKSSFDVYLNYILDREFTINMERELFIKENKEKIYSTIVFNKKLEKELELLKEDKDYVMLRKMNEIFGDKEKKSLNILYKTDDGKEMKFKIDNWCYLEDKHSKIYNNRIIGLKDRDLFKETFRRDGIWGSDEIHPQFIEQISYGKKILYTKETN